MKNKKKKLKKFLKKENKKGRILFQAEIFRTDNPAIIEFMNEFPNLALVQKANSFEKAKDNFIKEDKLKNSPENIKFYTEEEILKELDDSIFEFLCKNPDIIASRISNYGHSIDLDSMTKEQHQEFFKICNNHREKYGIVDETPKPKKENNNTLNSAQIELVINWMNTWEQLKNTAIPMRFKEDFK